MRRLWWVVVPLFVALGMVSPAAFARATADGMATIAVSGLPKEGQTVYALILKGGPFEYDRDAVVFGNREHLLPAKPRGYYHEYTVPTPDSKNRGARRIICGGVQTAPDACYYTADHYQSFKRIRQ